MTFNVVYSYYTLYSISVFSLAKSLQLILEISATYRLVSAREMHYFQVPCDGALVVIFFKTKYN